MVTKLVNTNLFGSKSSSAKIAESCCRMSLRVISFPVLILSLVITILIFSQTIRSFWVFPGFFPLLPNIFALQFFLLVLVQPLTFSTNASDLLLSFGGLMVLK